MCGWWSGWVKGIAFINTSTAIKTLRGLGGTWNLAPLGFSLLFWGWQIAHPGERGTCATLHMPVMKLAQRHDQGRINFRKLNGKGENAHIKKTNSTSSACLGMWAPVLIVIFINFPSCLISGDNYHSQAIDTSLMGRSPAGMAGLGFSETQSPLSRLPCLCKEKCHVLALNKQTKPFRAGESHSGMQRFALQTKHPYPPAKLVLMNRDS